MTGLKDLESVNKHRMIETMLISLIMREICGKRWACTLTFAPRLAHKILSDPSHSIYLAYIFMRRKMSFNLFTKINNYKYSFQERSALSATEQQKTQINIKTTLFERNFRVRILLTH